MNTIKLIDVYGQFNSQGSEHMYTYFGPDFDKKSDWSSRMDDVRNGEFGGNVRHCYCTWCSKDGWWVAIIQKSPDDKRGGYAMLSLCIGKNRPLYGEEIVRLLLKSWQAFVVDRTNWNDDFSERFLMNCDTDVRYVPCRTVEFKKPSIPANSAYWSYSSEEELNMMMAYLPQSEYENYSRIFFVPQSETQGMPIDCLNEKMKFKRCFRIQCSDDCQLLLDVAEIEEDKSFEIKYLKSGCDSEIRVLKGGNLSNYAYVKDGCMIVRPAKEAGVKFNRTIKVQCKDKDGRQIEDFNVINYSQHISGIVVSKHSVTIPEECIEQVELTICPCGDKYERIRRKLSNEQVKNNIFTVVLDPKAYKVQFQIRDKSCEGDFLMNPEDIYNKKGSFVCRIDDENKTIKYILQYDCKDNQENVGGSSIGGYHHHHHGGVRRDFQDWGKYGLFTLGVLALAYLIWLILGVLDVTHKPWPFKDKTPENVVNVSQSITNENEGVDMCEEFANEENQMPTMDSVAWKADVDYLKKYDDWSKDSLKTIEFQTAYDALLNVLIKGDVEGVIQSDSLFNSIAENRKNGYYKEIIKGLKAIQKSGNQEIKSKAEEELKRISKIDESIISIEKLSGSVNFLLENEKTQGNVPPVKPKPAQPKKGDTDNKTNAGGRPNSSESN